MKICLEKQRLAKSTTWTQSAPMLNKFSRPYVQMGAACFLRDAFVRDGAIFDGVGSPSGRSFLWLIFEENHVTTGTYRHSQYTINVRIQSVLLTNTFAE